MSIDRELMELAAKAAGIPLQWPVDKDSNLAPRRTDTWDIWSPIQDDGDAMRLAVKLKIDVYHYPRADTPHVAANDEYNKFGGCYEDYDSDPLLATRYAITRVAIEIGKNMP